MKNWLEYFLTLLLATALIIGIAIILVAMRGW